MEILNNLIENFMPKKIKSIFIIGEVEDDMSHEIIQTLFETNWQEYSELAIYISSGGGSLFSCFAMIDAIGFIRDNFDIKVTTYGLGETSSAGFFLLLVGDTRIIFPNCMIFVHEHLTIGEDTSSYSDKKKEQKDQDVIYKMYIDYTAKRLNISISKVRFLLKKNRYLKPSELSKYNIINKNYNEK